MIKNKLIVIVLFLLPGFYVAQTDSVRIVPVTDSTEVVRASKKQVYGNARKATVMSAVLPGLGQAYNRKFWKIPIIYAGMGGCGYLFYVSNYNYKQVRKYLVAEYDGDPSTVNTSNYSGESLQELKSQYHKNRDFSALGVVIFYVLNIIDANVDAHLKTFDVSDDLSIHIDPWQTYRGSAGSGKMVTGLSIKLNFK